MACQLTQPTHGPYRRTHRASSSAPVANRRAESRVGRCLLVSCAPRCDRRFRSDGGGRQGGLSGNSEPRSRPAPDRCRCSRTPPDAETLRQFRRAVDKLDLPVSIEAFGPAHVYLFMGWVQGRGVSAGTQHRRQREVKAFFSWCRAHGLCRGEPVHAGADGPARAEGYPAVYKGRHHYLASGLQSPDLRGLSHAGDDPLPPDTGVRSSELVSTRLCDVVFDEGRVRVMHGKGRKQRWTAISEVALVSLRAYLEDFRGWLEGSAASDRRRPSPSQSLHERYVHSSRPEGRG